VCLRASEGPHSQAHDGTRVSPNNQQETTLATVNTFSVSSIADIPEHSHLSPALRTVHLVFTASTSALPTQLDAS
jgi:hypothetical protein